MKLWAPDNGNGSGGAAGAAATEPAPTEPSGTSLLGGDVAAEPKTASPVAGDVKADPKAEAKPDDKAAAKPVLVDDKWEPKAAEGITRDAKVLGAARELFKKHGFTAEQAQALVEFSDAQAKAQAETLGEADKNWTKELEADKDIGGTKLAATRESVRSMLRQLKSGPALSKWVDELGIGNAAPLVRVLAELASRTKEDSVKSTVVDPVAASQNEHERRMAKTYGNSHRKES